MPVFLLALLGLVGVHVAASASPGALPTLPPAPLVAMRTGHRYYFTFQVSHTIDDSVWFQLWTVANGGGSPPPVLADAATGALEALLQSLGFSDIAIVQDLVSGRSSSPVMWSGSATFQGQDGEPVEQLNVVGPTVPTVVLWSNFIDLGIPLPVFTPLNPPASVQGLPCSCSGIMPPWEWQPSQYGHHAAPPLCSYPMVASGGYCLPAVGGGR